MSDKKIFPGKGCGILLEVMKRREEEKRKQQEQQSLAHSVETPSQLSSHQTRSYEGPSRSSSGDTSTTVSRGRGRAKLIDLLKQRSSSSASEPNVPVTSHGAASYKETGHVTIGRGNLAHLLQKHTQASLNEPSTSTSSSAHVRAPSQKDPGGVLGALADLKFYDDPPSQEVESLTENIAPICRQGTSGTQVELYSNYINLELEPGRGLFQYEVKFSPDIDAVRLRRHLLNQHSLEIGQERTFDGMTLFLPRKLPQNVTTFRSVHPDQSLEVILTVIYKKKQSMSENVQFFNVLFARIMRALQLVRIGRQSYNPKCSHIINQYHLEVWPGYVTAVNEHEGGLKLCLDIKHRVLRTQTVRDLMTDIYQRQSRNYKEYVMREIIGSSVLTRYNNRSYRIDDIAWDKTPKYKFLRKGEEISLIDYYARNCNVRIKDEKQPLLVHRATERIPSGEKQEKILLLIPELCYISGLTENMRSNYKMMKNLNEVTKISPNVRRDEIELFVKQIQENEVTRDILSGWGLRLSNNLIKFSARTLMPERIFFGDNKTYFSQERSTDWTSSAVRNTVLRTPHLNKWYIIYLNRDENVVGDFLSMLQNIVKAIGMRVSHPQQIILRDDRNESYLQEIRNNFDRGYELVVAVFPTNRTDRYNSLKRLCCVERPIASQVIISKTIANPSKLKSVTEKIALQINCKLGGALWTVTLPLKNCMVCGMDVYHSGIGSGLKQNVAGFVASLDAQLTKWHSRVCMQASKQELVDMLQMCLISAINAYRKYNNVNPQRIIIYRDGVGDGDLDYVAKYEVKQLIATFSRIDPYYKPELSVIVVQKRINTRLFIDNRGDLGNPPPGTVVDSCIVRRNYYDFFLVPQNVRQGSVTPIHYIVIYDSSSMETDHMQRLTYKLCHLYYNWPGTIRVPAPCQYAHKLVYQVGQSLQVEPHHSLEDILYYL